MEQGFGYALGIFRETPVGEIFRNVGAHKRQIGRKIRYIDDSVYTVSSRVFAFRPCEEGDVQNRAGLRVGTFHSYRRLCTEISPHCFE